MILVRKIGYYEIRDTPYGVPVTVCQTRDLEEVRRVLRKEVKV